MTTIHDQLTAIQRHGASTFGETSLAHSHRPVARRVRRDRAVRGSVATLAGVGVVGAGTFGILQLRGADALAPAGSPSPTGAGSDGTWEVVVDGEVPVGFDVIVTVEPGDRADQIIARLAEAYEASADGAGAAVDSQLPPEADGNPEGWLAAGEHSIWIESDATADAAMPEHADSMVSATVQILESNDVPRDEWQQVITIASIAQAESRTDEDLSGLTAVIRNRLENGMKLQIESPLQYYADINGLEPADDGWDIDTQFNTYLYEGLPPTPINSPSEAAIAAAANPADEDWLYFVVNSDTGAVLFATTFREHQENLVELGLLQPEDVL